ncbi:MAG: ABC transporter permease [Capnocytophaga sp.]|nr:ABC transporter permease [Capnocytophaga sp.]
MADNTDRSVFHKLLHYPLSIIGLGIIVCYGCIAVFAYALAPDNSRYANQMHLAVHSQPPGYSALMLTVPDANAPSISERFLSGVRVPTTEIAIQSYRTAPQGIWYIPAAGNSDVAAEEILVSWQQFPDIPKNEIVQQYIRNKTFWLGTDKYGRDMLSRMLVGTRVSFGIGFVAVCISLIVGITLGSIAGYYGGKPDAVIMWLINVVWSIPTLLLVIAFTLALGKGYWQVFVAVGLTMWVEVARIVRGQIISAKKNQYVEAAYALGYSDFRIISKHLFPNIFAPLIVISAANFASAILIESGLSFLGIGSQPPNPSWGSMIKDHYNYLLMGKPYLALIPGIAIMSLVMAFMLLSNKLRDVLDTK